MSDKPLLTYHQAAQILGLPIGTLYALVHHNRVPHIRLGRRLVRFDRGQLEEFIDAHRVETAVSRSGTRAPSSGAAPFQPSLRTHAGVTKQ